MKHNGEAEAGVIRTTDIFKGARASLTPKTRLEEVRARAKKFRETLLSGKQVRFYKTCELVRVPYPVRYAFANVYTQRPLPTPVLHIVNRLYIVQFDSSDGVKTLLFSPSDVLANAETRYFKRLGAGDLAKMEGKVGEFSPGGILKTLAQVAVAPQGPTVVEWLSKVGLRPDDIDYISYDHLHTQDVRNWLGTAEKPGVFPRAKLLITTEEWESAKGLTPPQADWYCPHGIEGIDTNRVVFLNEDVFLGEGVALIRTPGHTMGNHSLVANTAGGVFVTSENGVGVDNYHPMNSRINAVRNHAKKLAMEVILNGNTQESSVDQYISMVQEKEMAGPCVANPEFCGTATSSEFTAWWLFRGMNPSFTFGDLQYGALVKR